MPRNSNIFKPHDVRTVTSAMNDILAKDCAQPPIMSRSICISTLMYVCKKDNCNAEWVIGVGPRTLAPSTPDGKSLRFIFVKIFTNLSSFC